MVADILSREERAEAERLASRTTLPVMGAELVSEVASIFRIKEDDIYGERRFMRFVHARRVIACALYKRGWTYYQIGELLNRDHTTIIHSVRDAMRDQDLRSLAFDVA